MKPVSNFCTININFNCQRQWWIGVFWVCGRAQGECKVTFMKGCVPVGRYGLAGIRSRTNPPTVSGYWQQNVGCWFGLIRMY